MQQRIRQDKTQTTSLTTMRDVIDLDLCAFFVSIKARHLAEFQKGTQKKSTTTAANERKQIETDLN